MLVIDFRDVPHGTDVDFLMWKHIIVGNKHTAEQCALHVLVVELLRIGMPLTTSNLWFEPMARK